jgi:acid phosphatase (class A)
MRVYLILLLFLTWPLYAGEWKNSIDDIKFPNSGWSEGILGRFDQGPSYLPENVLDGVVAPFTANSSTETRQELDVLLQLQATARTPATIARIELEEGLQEGNWLRFIARDFITDFAPYPLTQKLLLVAKQEADYFVIREKLKYKRARPSQLEPKLSLLITMPPHAAYPSGHAMAAETLALVMQMVDPAHADLYKKSSREIAHRREIAGVHYASDSAAGQKLAAALVTELFKLPEFEKLLEEAKGEFIKTPLTVPPITSPVQ